LKGIVAKARLLRSQVTYDNAINDPRTKALPDDMFTIEEIVTSSIVAAHAS